MSKYIYAQFSNKIPSPTDNDDSKILLRNLLQDLTKQSNVIVMAEILIPHPPAQSR